MSTNFRLELIEPSAREVEWQQFFLALALFRGMFFSSLAPPRSSLSTRVKKNLSSRRLFKLEVKISGHAVESENSVLILTVSKVRKFKSNA